MTQIATHIGPISVASRQSRAYLSYVGPTLATLAVRTYVADIGPILVRCWRYWQYIGTYAADIGPRSAQDRPYR